LSFWFLVIKQEILSCSQAQFPDDSPDTQVLSTIFANPEPTSRIS
jgi:hypothetical protein